MKLMVESGDTLVKTWEQIIDSEGEDGIVEIMADQHVRNFTSYIASKMLFGNDHHKGIKIFPKCQALINAMGGATTLGIPLSRYVRLSLISWSFFFGRRIFRHMGFLPCIKSDRSAVFFSVYNLTLLVVKRQRD